MNTPSSYHLLERSFGLLAYFALFLVSCDVENSGPKPIVYINSYHAGHPSSDEIMQGFMDEMPKDSFDVYAWYMDTKRNTSLEFIKEKASQLLDSIQQVDPEILVVSDDNAIKYLVEPNLSSLKMPIIFCGVNWTHTEYDLPSEKVTGILEILPVYDALMTMKKHDPKMKRVTILNENTTTSRKEEQLLDTLFQRAGFKPTFTLVDDFEQWKSAFSIVQDSTDLIYFSTHAAIEGWDQQEAVEFIYENIKVPIITCEDFMMPYAVLGLTKVAKEHGEWAASVAKELSNGIKVEDFPVTRNQQAVLWFNPILAKRISFEPNSEVLEKARIVN